MSAIRIGMVAVLLLAAPAPARAQVLDLAGPETQTYDVAPGTISTALITNRVPGFNYTVLISLEQREIPPIDLPDAFKTGEVFWSGFMVCNEAPVNDWLASLESATDESSVASAVSKTAVEALRKQMQGSRGPEDGEICWDLVKDKVDTAIAATRATVNLSGYPLVENQRLVVTVTRAAATADVRTWRLVFSTPPPGRWLTTWGFGFTTDRSDHYIQQPQPDGTFKIVEGRDIAWKDMDLEFLPAVFFHWMPRDRESRDWMFSPFTAGLGINKEAPAVLVGVSGTRRHNLSLIAGVAVTRARRLNRSYEPNQSLKEALSDEALFENTYRPSIFVSVAIRFSRSPFGSDQDETETASASSLPAAQTTQRLPDK